MPITFNCPCGKTLKVPDEHAGRRAKCPVCAAVVNIPGPDPVLEVVEEKPKPPVAPGAKPTQQPAANDDDSDGGAYGLAEPESTLDDPSGRRPRGRPGLY